MTFSGQLAIALLSALAVVFLMLVNAGMAAIFFLIVFVWALINIVKMVIVVDKGD